MSKAVLLLALLAALYGIAVWWDPHGDLELNPKPGMSPGLVDLLTKTYWARVDWCHQWAKGDNLATCLRYSEEALRQDVEGNDEER